MKSNGIFRFHAVGQGLFYSGLINGTHSRQGEAFSFVYDCGSSSPRRFLHREIDDFKELLPNARSRGRKRLDLLIVSHMHDDHVNGLEYLLENVEVNTVVMPYTDSVIQLLARAESTSEEEFLSSFYMDPIGWFVSRGVHRILLIGSPPEEYYGNNESNDQDRAKYHDDFDSIHVDLRCILKTDKIDKTDILYLENEAHAEISLSWIFRFSNLFMPKTEDYIDVVDKFQKEKMRSLDDIFRDSLMTKELARRLRSVIPSEKTINRTSVVVEHEPLFDDEETVLFQPSISYWISKYIGYYYHCGRTLLTGDIELKQKETKQILKKEKYAVFQYPHHGARNALPDSIDIPLGHSMIVIPAGIINKYGHPDPDVIRQYENSFIVDERNPFDYRIVVGNRQKG